MRTFDAQALPFQLKSEKIKPLFKTKPLIHLSAIIMNWIIIFSMIVLWSFYPSVLLYLLGIIVIGARMHALAILMHDAAHYRFLKNRKWNDRWTNFLTLYPIFTSIDKYRANHLSHHQHLNTHDDPDWVAKLTKRSFTFPKTKVEFITTVLSYFFLIQGIMDAVWFAKRFALKPMKTKSVKFEKYLPIIFHVCLAITLTIFNLWLYYLIFWIVPYLTTFFMFQYIRSVAEHFGDLEYDDLLTSTRTVKTNWIERFIIAPHNVGYHLEHHLYPGIPYYNLPKLHKLLMEETRYYEKAHVTKGYTMGLIQELSKRA